MVHTHEDRKFNSSSRNQEQTETQDHTLAAQLGDMGPLSTPSSLLKNTVCSRSMTYKNDFFLWAKDDEGHYQRNNLIVNEEEGSCSWVPVGKVFKVVSEEEYKSNPEGCYFYEDQFDACIPCWLVPL